MADQYWEEMALTLKNKATGFGLNTEVELVPGPTFILWKFKITEVEGAGTGRDGACRSMVVSPRQLRRALNTRSAWSFWNCYSL